MKYFGRINDPKDLVTKEYVDGAVDEYVSIERIRTGNPVQFVGDSATVITDVTDYIEPAQDLNGYNKPWAPGAGKNLIPFPYLPVRDALKDFWSSDSEGIIYANGMYESAAPAWNIGQFTFRAGVHYILNGSPVSNDCYVRVHGPGETDYTISRGSRNGNDVEISFEEDTTLWIDVRAPAAVSFDNLEFRPMLRLASESDPTYEPYANACPITGFDQVTLKRYGVTESDNPQVINVTFGQTVYSGTYEALFGTLTVTSANIASYAGETLQGKWLSSMDVYSPGATPTTGAQVVYELSQPVTYQLTPNQILALIGQNTVSTDVGTLSVSFIREPVTRRAIMPKAKPVTLTLVGWNNKSQTVSVSAISGIEGTQLIQPVPASASKAAYESAGVQASAEGVGTLTFTCDSVPESDLTVYVVVTELEVVA